ncbi:MAG TPA: sugar phosphate isomerase/epimerase family protein [Planctomycetota bacterium]|jgi:sugar phosphate isomerase/epimerase
MHLGLMAYQLAKDWDLETTAKMCREGKMESFEFFAEPSYKQKISLEMQPAEAKKCRKVFADNGVHIAGLAITERYDGPSVAAVKEAVARTKQYVLLAVDMGAPRLRCLGDRFHDGEPKAWTIARVSNALSEIVQYSAGLGVDIGFEMHGSFSAWEDALEVVKRVNHPRCYLVHNSQPANTPVDDFDRVFEIIRPHLGHVHFHDLLDTKFPYKKFIRKLRDSNYEGYCSLELEPSQDPLRVMHLTRAVFEEFVAK